jgi:hypothetical protein
MAGSMHVYGATVRGYVDDDGVSRPHVNPAVPETPEDAVICTDAGELPEPTVQERRAVYFWP